MTDDASQPASASQLLAWAADAGSALQFSPLSTRQFLLFDADAALPPAEQERIARWLVTLDCPTFGIGTGDNALTRACDLRLDSPAQAQPLLANIRRNPVAAAVLVQTLRLTEQLPVMQALEVESLAYAVLQGGAEFKRWLETRPHPNPPLRAGEGEEASATDTRHSLSTPPLHRGEGETASTTDTRHPLSNPPLHTGEEEAASTTDTRHFLSNPPPPAGEGEGGGGSPAVLIERAGDVLSLELNRPSNRNALSIEMRDALVEALQLVLADDSIRRVRLSGRGKCFSVGGDLTEFGSLPDPASAHAIRRLSMPGRFLAQCAERVECHVQGACVGSGMELPAFCRRVIAAADTYFHLPELQFGLIPGGGGCVSIPRRIGRQRTAWMVLSGKRIKAQTALEWGLVDVLA